LPNTERSSAEADLDLPLDAIKLADQIEGRESSIARRDWDRLAIASVLEAGGGACAYNRAWIAAWHARRRNRHH